MIVEIRQVGKQLRTFDVEGNSVKRVPSKLKRTAFDRGMALATTNNGDTWTEVPRSQFMNLKKTETRQLKEMTPEDEMSHKEVTDFLGRSYGLKPRELVMSELNWKYMVRTALRGKNLMMIGPSGCGKTMSVKALVSALERPYFYFNLGATQDPRSALIGNTHFSKEDGTFFRESTFVKAIQTPNAIILLDELSRAHPDASNILMTVLDDGQRYLRLDDHEDSPIINVAKGVTFVATANIGTEYTGTRTMDRALVDRFVQIEMSYLPAEDETDLLKMFYPNVKNAYIGAIVDIANDTRSEVINETGQLSTAISTRATVEMASLIYDGFSLAEAAEVVIYPLFSNVGGVESERTFVKQIVQKYVGTADDSLDDMFGVGEEVDAAYPF